jgi:pyruvate kinase
MRVLKNVKVLATLGPSSSDRRTIRALVEAGADVFRLNMSHGDQDGQRARYELIREIEQELDRPIGVLADLQGPKIRLGTFANGPHEVHEGDAFRFDSDETPGDKSRVYLPHPEVLQALTEGATVLVNDGKVRMKVTKKHENAVDTVVVVGGEISDRKGMNLPDVVLPLAALSEKDRSDLEFACELGADWIALSFVQRAADIEEAQALIKGRALVMTKVEKPAAVSDFTSILEASDGIMVARGDLGVEMDLPDLPAIQKRLIRECRNVGKPVVVATQMLESMIHSPVPTRAEISDVAGAIYDGADAVMLSAESAAGDFPIEAVSTMQEVARKVEADPEYRKMIDASRTHAKSSIATAITSAAREVADAVDVKAICCFTHSGTTAGLASRERPSAPIIALTPFRKTARQLTMYWGLHCVVSESVERFKMAVISAARAAKTLGIADDNDRIAVTAGVPFNKPGTTNILRIAPVDETAIYEGEPGGGY